VNRIIHNLVVDFIRKINAKKHPPIKHVDDETFTRLCEDIRDSHQPELDYIEKEQIKELFGLINQHLNSYQFHVLHYTVQGYQPSDIAKRLRKTPEQISKTLYRIRRKLRSILEPKNQVQKMNNK
jgi:RNA polymerase sigma factor (sigma-70 family)